jgi:hypothetical protein
MRFLAILLLITNPAMAIEKHWTSIIKKGVAGEIFRYQSWDDECKIESYKTTYVRYPNNGELTRVSTKGFIGEPGIELIYGSLEICRGKEIINTVYRLKSEVVGRDQVELKFDYGNGNIDYHTIIVFVEP